MKNKQLFLTILIPLLLILSPGGAIASPIYLSQSNELPDGLAYATVNIVFENNKAQFEVDVNKKLFSGTGDNFGIDKFYFNTNLDLTEDDFDIDGGGKVSGLKNVAYFGRFNYELKIQPRVDPLLFTIEFQEISIENFIANDQDYTFAAHIADFTFPDSGEESAFFADGAPVPEPATMLLLGAGLIGIAGVGRKKFFKKNMKG